MITEKLKYSLKLNINQEEERQYKQKQFVDSSKDLINCNKLLLGLKGTMSHPFIPFYIIHKDSDNREEFHSFSNLDDEPSGVFIKN